MGGRATGPKRDRLLPVPDEVLLRRFGHVRAVGGAAYFLAVGVLFVVLGTRVWPLLLGVPVLAVATTAYFRTSADYPRTSVIASLVADALVLAAAVAFLGGTGSGMLMLQAIVVVSAGILLGPATAAAFTGLAIVLGLLQLLLEQAGIPPALLHRPDLGERLPVLLVSLAGLAAVGYLSATYASRLHDLVVEAGEEVAAARRRGHRRRAFVERATLDVRKPLAGIEEIAETLESSGERLDEAARRSLAARLRIGAMHLDAEVGQLADLGLLEVPDDLRQEPLRLARVVGDCVVALGGRLDPYRLDVDVGGLRIVGDRRAARRVVFNLLENVVDHTPPGTRVRVAAAPTAGYAVLAVVDDGPGIDPQEAGRLFEPAEGEAARVGLPLVKVLCEAIGASIRYEPVPGGSGSRFLVSFRLAPPGASEPGEPAAQGLDPRGRSRR